MDHFSKTTSQVSQTLAEMLKSVPDDDAGLTPCQIEGTCPVAPGIEHVFVAATAHYALKRIAEDDPAVQFHEVIYSPHSTIENKCGFDLSLGHYKRPCRVRLMHKLLNFKFPGAKWCDEEWVWSSGSEVHNHRHLELLISAYTEPAHKKCYEPFVFLNTCYCIHEYRRLGCEYSGVQIPKFTDYRRTAAIDLRPLASLQNWRTLLGNPKVSIVAKHALENEKVIASLMQGKQVLKELPVLSAAALIEHVAERTRRATPPD